MSPNPKPHSHGAQVMNLKRYRDKIQAQIVKDFNEYVTETVHQGCEQDLHSIEDTLCDFGLYFTEIHNCSHRPFGAFTERQRKILQAALTNYGYSLADDLGDIDDDEAKQD